MVRVKSYRYKRRFKPRRYKPKRKSILRSRFFWLSILGFIFVCLVFYFLFFSSVFKIKDIKIVAPKEISLVGLQTLLKEELSKPCLHFLKKDSFFLVDSPEIARRVLGEFPEIKKASLKRKFPHTLILEVEKREAAGVVCFEGENCYLVDKTGVIFETFSTTSAATTAQGLVFVYLEDEKTKWLGEEVIPQEKMAQILEIFQDLKEKMSIAVKHFSLSGQKNLEVKTTEGWQVYFDLETDIKLALIKMKLLLEKEILQEERKNLEYIDLRFAKAYYKYF